MRVLMLAPGFSMHSRRPLGWLLDRGCEVVFMDWDDPLPAPRAGYRFVRITAIRGMRLWRRLLGPARAARFQMHLLTRALRRLGREAAPDVTHVHWVDTRATACARAGLHPLVVSVWGSDVNAPRDPDAAGEALAAADLVIVDEPGMADKCRRLAGRPVSTELLHQGVDTTRFRPGLDGARRAWRTMLAIPDASKVALSLRGWHPSYGHHVILEAFHRAMATLAQPAVLVFKIFNRVSYPDAGSYERDVRARVEAVGLGSHVRWIEHEVDFDEMPGVYAFADVIVNAPEQDAMPATFFEAAASERPVVSWRLPAYVGSFAERVFRMVEPGDVDALAAALVAELEQPTPPGRLAEARRLVEREADESVVASRLMELYRQVARTKSSSRRLARK